MIDVHRCKAALVVIGVPERQLLVAVRGTERVVDIEDVVLARLHGRAGLVDGKAASRAASLLLRAFPAA
jgi:hypothetical protein